MEPAGRNQLLASEDFPTGPGLGTECRSCGRDSWPDCPRTRGQWQGSGVPGAHRRQPTRRRQAPARRGRRPLHSPAVFRAGGRSDRRWIPAPPARTRAQVRGAAEPGGCRFSAQGEKRRRRCLGVAAAPGGVWTSLLCGVFHGDRCVMRAAPCVALARLRAAHILHGGTRVPAAWARPSLPKERGTWVPGARGASGDASRKSAPALPPKVFFKITIIITSLCFVLNYRLPFMPSAEILSENSYLNAGKLRVISFLLPMTFYCAG